MANTTKDKLLDVFGGALLVIALASVAATTWFGFQVYSAVNEVHQIVSNHSNEIAQVRHLQKVESSVIAKLPQASSALTTGQNQLIQELTAIEQGIAKLQQEETNG